LDLINGLRYYRKPTSQDVPLPRGWRLMSPWPRSRVRRNGSVAGVLGHRKTSKLLLEKYFFGNGTENVFAVLRTS
jgi:hypothetical protein